MHLITISILSAIAGYFMTDMAIMPRWYYRLKFKPFTCSTCMAFWLCVVGYWLPIVPAAFASMGLVAFVYKYLNA